MRGDPLNGKGETLRNSEPTRPALPAIPLLRLQCLEPAKIRGEAALHARESGEEKIGIAPKRLALEQFFVLRQEQWWPDPHRSSQLKSRRHEVKKPPFKNGKTGHPIQLQSLGHPPEVQNRSKPGPPVPPEVQNRSKPGPSARPDTLGLMYLRQIVGNISHAEQ